MPAWQPDGQLSLDPVIRITAVLVLDVTGSSVLCLFGVAWHTASIVADWCAEICQPLGHEPESG